MNTLYTVSFSPTGSSLKVARQIAAAFEAQKAELDLCPPAGPEIQMDGQDAAIFAVPCYGGRIPPTAVQRLERVRGRQTPAILCVTFGNRAFEDALLELADRVQANGFRVIAGCAACTEHNIMRVFGRGRPDERDLGEIRDFARRAAQKLERGEKSAPTLPGNRPYKAYHAAQMPIQVDGQTCARCGLCAGKCPVKAISPDGQQTDPAACISCMRCIQICPHGSRRIPEAALNGLIQKLGPALEGRKENAFYL